MCAIPFPHKHTRTASDYLACTILPKLPSLAISLKNPKIDEVIHVEGEGFLHFGL
jgi:hypothetical protein